MQFMSLTTCSAVAPFLKISPPSKSGRSADIMEDHEPYSEGQLSIIKTIISHQV